MSADGGEWAVVVVNYGSSALLEVNLAATVAEATPDIVVVVDNPTTSAERERMRDLAHRQGWTLVEPDTNTGFGGGVNLGVAAALEAGARGLLLLNPDAQMGGDSIDVLRKATADAPLVLCAPRIVTPAGAVWFAGSDVSLVDGRTRSHAKRAQHPGEATWEWLTGACLWFTAALWHATGGFDEDYFLYWEDVDFSRRVVLAGGTVKVVTDSVAVHDEGATHRSRRQPNRAKSETYYYFNIRNRMLFATRFLDEEGIRRWRAGVTASAREVILRGGRAQLLRSSAPWRAYFRGVRDARRIADERLGADFGRVRAAARG
ncbi:glycosyltransferase family 2 protein [Microbacterium sp. NPDC091382]|uniref:glycosyltransferase family 2 protein n=1 Tax=Microbacterium sp. NPDC091382 TaxID=3364210 RepID=UPI0037FF0DFE